MSLAGITHFVVGRSLIYELIQIVGANIAAILRRANILITVVIGITVLHEPISWQLLIGVWLIVVGITLPGLNPQTIKNNDGRFIRIPAKAWVYGFGCSVAIGISPIFIKLGLKGSESPIAGAFISFLAATTVLISVPQQNLWVGYSHNR